LRKMSLSGRERYARSAQACGTSRCCSPRRSLRDAQKEAFARISAAVDEGPLVKMDREALNATLGEIAAIRRELRIARATPPPPPPPVEEGEAQSGATGEGEKQDVLEGTREAQTAGEKPEPEGEKAAGEETQPESSP
jgi:hypothetical protein